jgi:hypothetical protein
MSPIEHPPTKLCIACTRDLPLDQFPQRVQGQPSRRGRCRRCLADYMAHYRCRQRVKRLDRVASALARETNSSSIEQFLSAVMHQFGGPDAFALEWKTRYDAVCQKNPSGRRVGNMLAAIGRIAEAYQAERQSPRDQVLATAEELDREVEDRLLEIIREHPQMVMSAAIELGWIVHAPGGRKRHGLPREWRVW